MDSFKDYINDRLDEGLKQTTKIVISVPGTRFKMETPLEKFLIDRENDLRGLSTDGRYARARSYDMSGLDKATAMKLVGDLHISPNTVHALYHELYPSPLKISSNIGTEIWMGDKNEEVAKKELGPMIRDIIGDKANFNKMIDTAEKKLKLKISLK